LVLTGECGRCAPEVVVVVVVVVGWEDWRGGDGVSHWPFFYLATDGAGALQRLELRGR
jgi:hypothetical protein